MKFPGIDLTENVRLGAVFDYFQQTHFVLSDLTIDFSQDYFWVKAKVNGQSVKLKLDPQGRIEGYSCENRHYFGQQFCWSCWTVISYLRERHPEVPYQMAAKDTMIFQIEELKEDLAFCVAQTRFLSGWLQVYQDQLAPILTDQVTPIRLESYTQWDDQQGTYKIRFRIGQDKLYVIKSLEDQLLTPLANHQLVKLGKQAGFLLDEARFDELAKRTLDFIRRHQSSIYQKGAILVDANSLKDYIQTFKDQVDFDWQPLKEHFDLSLSQPIPHTYQVQLDLKGYDLVAEAGDCLLFCDLAHQAYYYFCNRLEAFWVKTVHDYESFQWVPESQLPSIKRAVLNQAPLLQLRGDWPDISDDLAFFVDLTDQLELTLTLESLTPDSPQVRLILESLKTSYQAQTMGPWQLKISQETKLDQFIQQTLPHLKDFGEVYISQAVKSLTRPRRLPLKFKLGMNKGRISLDLQSGDLDLKQVNQILKSYHKKRHFYQLSKQERVLIDPEQLSAVESLLQDLALKKLNQHEQVPLYRYYQLKAFNRESLDLEFDCAIEDCMQTPSLPIDPGIRSILYPYQVQGVEWLLKLRAMGLGGILADDMGLGKSLQLIAYMASVVSVLTKPILIVVPASLIYNWQKELQKFPIPVQSHLITGKAAQRRAIIEAYGNLPGILITSYDYLRRDLAYYQDLTFDTLVLDEGQYIKNAQSQTARAIKTLKADYRFALTGTPMENNLAELWSLFDFLLPGYLYSYPKFKKRFEHDIVKEDAVEASTKLKQMIEPFMLRRMKKEVMQDLPDKLEENYIVSLEASEEKLYQASLMEAKQKLAQEAGEDAQAMQVLALLTRLRQLALDPRLIYDNIQQASSKMKAAIELIQQALANGQSVLVFSNFTSALDLLQDSLTDRAIPCLILTGQTPKLARQRAVEQFQASPGQVFLISLKAGGTGLNLTQASIVIHLDPWWNESAQNQATDRAYRIGQENNVTVYKLIAKGTLEEKMEALKQEKSALFDRFVEGSTGSVHHLSAEELRHLFLEGAD